MITKLKPKKKVVRYVRRHNTLGDTVTHLNSTSRQEFLSYAQRGDIISILLPHENARWKGLVYEGILEGSKPNEFCLGFLEQTHDVGILSWRGYLKDSQFTQKGIVFKPQYTVKYFPTRDAHKQDENKQWAESYVLLTRAQEWRGELKLEKLY